MVTGYTLGGMADKPADPIDPIDPPDPPDPIDPIDPPDRRALGDRPIETARQTGPHKPQGGEGTGGEHLGPVAIARHVKEDGRALILYARDPGSRR